MKERGHLTLPDFAAAFAVSDILQQPQVGGSSVAMLPFATQAFQLFWWGASLGLARGESLPVMAQTLVGCQSIALALEPSCSSYDEALGRANELDWVTEYIERLASDGLKRLGREPESLLDLFAESFCPPELDFRDSRKIQSMRGLSIPLDNAGLHGAGCFLAGLSLGVSDPNLAKRLNANVYGTQADQWYTELEGAGGLGPPRPDEERRVIEDLRITDWGREVAVALLATYLQMCDPGLLEPLGIEAQLPDAATGAFAPPE